MSLVNKIISIVEDNLQVPCLFDDWNRLNKETNKLRKSNEDHDYKFPAVYIVIPSQGTIDTRFGRYRETTQLNINFVIETLERADFDGIENESRIEQMKQLAIRFLHHFNKSDFFEALPDTVEFRQLYMITDNSLTGVSITILAKELIGTCFDDVEEVEEDEEDGGDYFVYTIEDGTDIRQGYYSPYNGSFIENHNYTTCTIKVSNAKGRMFKYTGFLDTSVKMIGKVIEASVFEPIKVIRGTLGIFINTTDIYITTRSDVPFRLEVGTIEENNHFEYPDFYIEEI